MKTGLVATIKSLFLLLCLVSYGFAAELDLADDPLGAAYGGSPNVMLLIDTSKSMVKKVAGSNKSRITEARETAKKLVASNPDIRFGLARLNGQDGGIIDCPIASECAQYDNVGVHINKSVTTRFRKENLLKRLTRYKEDMLSGATPIAEAMYEVTRYFRGMESYDYTSDRLSRDSTDTDNTKAPPVAYQAIQYKSPLQYSCQKNFVIVLSDGSPSREDSFPDDDPFTGNTNAALPNWDGESDDQPVNNSEENRNQFEFRYLDDIAQFARELPQKIHTYTVGFAHRSEMLRAAAKNGGGAYYTADTANELSMAFTNAIGAIKAESLSSAAVAANSGRVQQGSRIFQARYNPQDWSGQLRAFDIITDPADGDLGQLKADSVWEAGDEIPGPGSRAIITNKESAGIKFREGKITGENDQLLFDSDDRLVSYIRGEDVDGYRQRNSNLGDIVNSAPVYVGQPAAHYRNSIEATSYASFRETYRARTPMIYVGANDGMLHGFDAASGVEKLAYIPGRLLPKLKHLADPEYRHKYYVDGSPAVVDAYVDGEWKTILVGGLNVGGQSIYALDVTDPDSFSEANAGSLFMWEFTDQEDPDLGYTFSKPAIVKIKGETDGIAGKWYAVFGNGYNNTEADGAASNSGDAVIYIVDLATGELASKITTEVGRAEDPTGQERPNGMATLTPVDIDGDSIADAIYGGDLFGNVWKVDLSNGVPQDMSNASRLFTACAANQCKGDYQPQPITTQLAVNRINGRIIVLFGTGKYIETTDATSASAEIQSFYGIWDGGEGFSGRADLQQQGITRESIFSYTNITDGEKYEYVLRTTSDNKPGLNKKGWYIDLVSPVTGADTGKRGERGERVIHRPVLRNGRVIFVTTTPSQESCGAEGSSWLMELDQETGGRPAINVLDLNKDGAFDSGDTVLDSDGNKITVSGEQQSGSVASPTILDGDNGVEYKYLSGDSGINVVKENSGGSSTGRQQWLQFNRK